MTQTAHTPTPWVYIAGKKGGGKMGSGNFHGTFAQISVRPDGEISNCESFTIHTQNSNEDAAFIVKACNAHDELVEALTDLMRARVRDNEVGPVTAKARAILAKVQP